MQSSAPPVLAFLWSPWPRPLIPLWGLGGHCTRAPTDMSTCHPGVAACAPWSPPPRPLPPVSGSVTLSNVLSLSVLTKAKFRLHPVCASLLDG